MAEPTKQQWQGLVNGIRNMIVNGVGLKCPFCGERKVSRIEGSILEVECGTRIVRSVAPQDPPGKHCVTQNGHELKGSKRYPYSFFDCIDK